MTEREAEAIRTAITLARTDIRAARELRYAMLRNGFTAAETVAALSAIAERTK